MVEIEATGASFRDIENSENPREYQIRLSRDLADGLNYSLSFIKQIGEAHAEAEVVEQDEETTSLHIVVPKHKGSSLVDGFVGFFRKAEENHKPLDETRTELHGIFSLLNTHDEHAMALAHSKLR